MIEESNGAQAPRVRHTSRLRSDTLEGTSGEGLQDERSAWPEHSAGPRRNSGAPDCGNRASHLPHAGREGMLTGVRPRLRGRPSDLVALASTFAWPPVGAPAELTKDKCGLRSWSGPSLSEHFADDPERHEGAGPLASRAPHEQSIS